MSNPVSSDTIQQMLDSPETKAKVEDPFTLPI